jgi:glycosyltransferase involved in cell wall biosynthesis
VELSAIVPTHNRPEVLRRCLETLREQAVDPAAFEVIVVDDGSPSFVEPTVNEVSASGPIRMRCERQPLSGLNTARNRGAAVAQGGVLAFLDDDTLVSPDWASALLAAFQDPDCAAVGGRVSLGLPGPAPRWLASRAYYLAEYELGAEPRWLDGDPLPVGANCAVRRGDFDHIGGFRPGLDRIGRSLVSNGDTDFFRRLEATGARLRYEPAAGVIHVVPASRLTIRFFARRHWAQGISDELVLAFDGAPVTGRHRLRLLGGIRDGLRGSIRDVVAGAGALGGGFEAAYWAGRLTASLGRSRKLARAMASADPPT